MNRQERKAAQKQLKQSSKQYSDKLEIVPESQWPRKEPGLMLLLRSKKFLVQVYSEKNDVIRLSVCRTQLNNKAQWEDNITWDELQELKRQAGFAQNNAVEVYPADKDIVNVANMRHLWILPTPLGFAWRN